MKFSCQIKKEFLKKYPDIPFTVKNFHSLYNKHCKPQEFVSYETVRLWLRDMVKPSSQNLINLSNWLVEVKEIDNSSKVLDYDLAIYCLSNIKLLDDISKKHLISYITYLLKTQQATSDKPQATTDNRQPTTDNRQPIDYVKFIIKDPSNL